MTVEELELERRQEELAPKENLRPYAGQWVALRNGHVVAADLDPVALREHEDVTDEDVLVPVAAGERDGGYFIL